MLDVLDEAENKILDIQYVDNLCKKKSNDSNIIRKCVLISNCSFSNYILSTGLYSYKSNVKKVGEFCKINPCIAK